MKGDRASASVRVAAPPERAFRVFTEEIDRWWRRGVKYRVGRGKSVVYVEPRVGGRVFETHEPGGAAEMGRVLVWDPPRALAFEWRAQNFAPSEKTKVTVTFAPSGSGTLVTVVHEGWAAIRPDHPARHGKAPGPFLAMLGVWWGEQLSSLRENVAFEDLSREHS